MAISKWIINGLVLLALMGAVSTGEAQIDDCSVIHRGFIIYDWKGKVPMHGVLYQYRKGSNFSVLEKKIDPAIRMELDPGDSRNPHSSLSVLTITFDGYNEFSPEFDYKLVLDNKTEYRFYDLETGRYHLSCGLYSGKVNQCDLQAAPWFLFPAECGESVK